MESAPPNSEYDAIVIGSGIGGLAAAAILARVDKMKVLVLEQHFEMGGMTHVFSRGRFKFDVGVHYIGRLAPGLIQRLIFDYITNKRLTWMAMPSPYDRFNYPSVSFGVPSDWNDYRMELRAKFPASKAAIERYFKDVQRGARWFVRQYLANFLPQPISGLLRASII